MAGKPKEEKIETPAAQVSIEEDQKGRVVVLEDLTDLEAHPLKRSEISTEVFMMMDRRDEGQILAAMQGIDPEEFAFQFKQTLPSGAVKTVTGISWAGTLEAGREWGGIDSTQIVHERESDDHYYVAVRAVDQKTGSARLGVKKQWKMMRLKTGKVVPNEYAYEQAFAKAQRNAIRALLPQAFIKDFLARAIEAKKKGKDGRAEKPAQKPKAGTEKKPEASSQECEATRRRKQAEQFSLDVLALCDLMNLSKDERKKRKKALKLTDAKLQTVEGLTTIRDALIDEAKNAGFDVSPFADGK